MTIEEVMDRLESVSTEALVETLAQRMQNDLRKKTGGDMKFGHFRIYVHEGAFSKVEAWPRDVLIKGEPLRKRARIA